MDESNLHHPHHSPLHRLSAKQCRDKTPSALFFRYNTQLGPPYQVLIDTNFINFSIRNKVSWTAAGRGVAPCHCATQAGELRSERAV